MSTAIHQYDADHHPAGDGHGPRPLPASLFAPELLAAWRTRALITCGIAVVLSVIVAFLPAGRSHILRAWLLGFMLCFTFTGGGLVLLMLQYVSGRQMGSAVASAAGSDDAARYH